MLKKNSFKLAFCFLLLFLFLGANFVSALEIDYPNLPGVKSPQDFVNDSSIASEDILSLYAKYFFNLAIWIAGIIALGALIYGGIRYLTSTGKPDTMASAKDQITGVFFGLLLLLSSYLVLSILNPELIILKISEPEPIEIIEIPEVPLPPIDDVKTSIDVEMPFSRVIETIFETYFWQLPDTVTWEPRMTRVKNNAETTKKLADNLLQQSEDLKRYSGQCTCGILRPDPPCNHYGCSNCPPTYCTSDPCREIRRNIQDTEDRNLENIYLGTEITEINSAEEEYTITTSLTEEIKKTDTEIKGLKKELNRLTEAERFIESCDWDVLNSLARFHNKQDYFEKYGRHLLPALFWDDVSIYYIDEWTNEPVEDWATFYCSVGGTFEEFPYPSSVPDEGEITGDETTEEVAFFGRLACSREAPVGEIIDRTKRTTSLLINKLETLVEWDKKLIDAVDRLQVLVSQCSSRRCYPICQCVSCGWHCRYCVEVGCFVRPELDGVCPKGEIDDQLREIQDIYQEITNLIEGMGDNETPEEIGILPIIDEIVPEILKDLQIEVRYPMSICSSTTFEERDVSFRSCKETIGSTDPDGVLVNECCIAWNEDLGGQTKFGDCLEECYLERGQTEYRECLQSCLDEGGDEELGWCRHHLNFFCCQAEE